MASVLVLVALFYLGGLVGWLLGGAFWADRWWPFAKLGVLWPLSAAYLVVAGGLEALWRWT